LSPTLAVRPISDVYTRTHRHTDKNTRADTHIGVARILSGGALFLTKKTDDLFLVVALKERQNTPPNLI